MKLALLLILMLNAAYASYPSSWWAPFPEEEAESWEVLPQDVSYPEVIASKRTELIVFSNLAHTPFYYRGEYYASIEGLWQSMKYPETFDANDPRHKLTGWPYTREEVRRLSMWDAKRAGDAANEINKAGGINWVSFENVKFNYKDHKSGSQLHYKIIKTATTRKVFQNPEIKELLIRTKGLTILPDHHQWEGAPPSYYYCDILMDIRDSNL
jgi:hypothetical protein